MPEYPITIDPHVAELASHLDEGHREWFEERSAIREVDALIPRREAEALGLLDVLSRYPEALTGVTVMQVEVDGATQWLLSSDSNAARQYLVDVGGTEIGAVNLADVIEQQYNGLAMLTSAG